MMTVGKDCSLAKDIQWYSSAEKVGATPEKQKCSHCHCQDVHR